MTKQELKSVYIQTLTLCVKENPSDYADKTINDIDGTVDKMIVAIENCITNHGHGSSGCDWITHNTAFRIACKAFGIKTSKQLRDVFNNIP